MVSLFWIRVVELNILHFLLIRYNVTYWVFFKGGCRKILLVKLNWLGI